MRLLPPLPWHSVAAATLFAGSMGMLLLGAFSIVLWGEPPWRVLGMIAATWDGPAALASADTIEPNVLLTGFAVHFALTFVYAVALASLVAELPRAWHAPAGVAFGAGLYLANMYGFSAIFGWFAALRTPDTLAAHLFYGLWLSAAVPPLRNS